MRKSKILLEDDDQKNQSRGGTGKQSGAGRFTQVLARLGTRIVVGDLSPVQLNLNRQHAARYDFASAIEEWVQIDICDLTRFASEAFECVVAYGSPLGYVLD
jgi:Methyltransferase domain